MKYDPANLAILPHCAAGPGCEEYASYKQYLAWIMGHAIVEYRLRVYPVWQRWYRWHKYHSKQVAILTIHYGHLGSADYGVGYFFA